MAAKRGSSRPRGRGRTNRPRPKGARGGAAPTSARVSQHAGGTQVELEIRLDEPDDPEALRGLLARALGQAVEELAPFRLLKRSLDARRRRIRHHWLFEFSHGEIKAEPLGMPEPRQVTEADRVLVVGDGPAGLFCAYQLARYGIGCTVLERGKLVQPRRHDLKALNQQGAVDVDSNYCFGEGGAGTYSDGKLYTRSHKRGDVRDVIELLAAHGAPADILTEARPHIGSNRLPQVVTRLREHLEQVGVRFRFGARVTDLLRTADGRCAGVRLLSGESLAADQVVLATGHSASAVYELLAQHGVPLEAKSFAVGVRVEHPQALINQIQYGAGAGHPRLPNAAYRIACDVEQRGVFSFCMCPGGFIVPASTQPERLVVNGMSLKRRDSPFANSGLVVQVEVEDVLRALQHRGLSSLSPALAGLELQRLLEAAAYSAGGGGFVAPATRVSDFVAGRGSSRVGDSSYIPGLRAADVAAVLDASGLDLARRLRQALAHFGRELPGYVTDQALLIGMESRTSSPVRMPRHPQTFELTGLPGVYPCGEGAGYAGGIVSAAVDGIRVAQALAARVGARA